CQHKRGPERDHSSYAQQDPRPATPRYQTKHKTKNHLHQKSKMVSINKLRVAFARPEMRQEETLWLMLRCLPQDAEQRADNTNRNQDINKGNEAAALGRISQQQHS